MAPLGSSERSPAFSLACVFGGLGLFRFRLGLGLILLLWRLDNDGSLGLGLWFWFGDGFLFWWGGLGSLVVLVLSGANQHEAEDPEDSEENANFRDLL